MTSKRRIKKEIDYVVSDLVLDCFTYINHYQESKDEEAMQIVQRILVLRNELRNQANHPEKKEGTKSKTYYDQIAKRLLEAINEEYSNLKKLLAPKA
jgi:hypothetical protein